MDILEEHGVNTIEHHIFHDFDEGIQHVQENPAPYVIKPLGEVQNVKRLLYVGNEDDGSDVVDVLKAYKKAWGHRMKGFQLQRKVEGVEIAICGFFNGEEFIEQVNFNFEHKKLFPGNIGPSTGEMGTSMFWAAQNKLFQETFGKLEGWLANEGYVGSIDINCIVNESGIYPLEFTPRFGYPTIALQEESFESSTGGGSSTTSHTEMTQNWRFTMGTRSASASSCHPSRSMTRRHTMRTPGMQPWSFRPRVGRESILKTRRKSMGNGALRGITGCPSS
nr:hypothetical protein [Halomicroarcula sp. SYNS111]